MRIATRPCPIKLKKIICRKMQIRERSVIFVDNSRIKMMINENCDVLVRLCNNNEVRKMLLKWWLTGRILQLAESALLRDITPLKHLDYCSRL